MWHKYVVFLVPKYTNRLIFSNWVGGAHDGVNNVVIVFCSCLSVHRVGGAHDDVHNVVIASSYDVLTVQWVGGAHDDVHDVGIVFGNCLPVHWLGGAHDFHNVIIVSIRILQKHE